MKPEIRKLRRTRFYTIDNEVYQMKLGPYALSVYNALSFHANPKQQVFYSQSALAEEIGISSRQCQRALHILQTRQLISLDCTKKRGTTNTYTLLPITKKNQEPPSDRQGVTTDSQGDTTDCRILSQKTDGNSAYINDLRDMSFPNKTNKQNNTTKLDEQKADKFSFQEREEQNPTASPGLQSGDEAPRASVGRFQPFPKEET